LYRDVAMEALVASEAEVDKHRRPREDGSPGHVITYDPGHTSFKQSMIAIVFAGMYMESQLWLFGCNLLGATEYKPIDKLPLDQRVSALGITDTELQADLKHYREVRKELVHEKPVPLSTDRSPIRVAQEQAAKAVGLMHRIDEALAERAT
jgi:hypothetical protein